MKLLKRINYESFQTRRLSLTQISFSQGARNGGKSSQIGYRQERNRGVPKGPCEDGYQFPRTPIFHWGPYEQLIEDLRCIDGPGLGEKAGSKVEHIDDLFSK